MNPSTQSVATGESRPSRILIADDHSIVRMGLSVLIRNIVNHVHIEEAIDGHSEPLYAKRFLKLGVLGYLDKESAADEIKKAIELVLNGQQYMSPTLKKYVEEDTMAKRADNPFEKLSNREIQIAKYLLLGYSLAEIRKVLNLHSSTVGTHKIRFFEKLKIKNVFELRELIKLYQIDLTKI